MAAKRSLSAHGASGASIMPTDAPSIGISAIKVEPRKRPSRNCTLLSGFEKIICAVLLAKSRAAAEFTNATVISSVRMLEKA
jgi:hypothetical protein